MKKHIIKIEHNMKLQKFTVFVDGKRNTTWIYPLASTTQEVASQQARARAFDLSLFYNELDHEVRVQFDVIEE